MGKMVKGKLVSKKVIHDSDAISEGSLGYTFWLNVSLILLIVVFSLPVVSCKSLEMDSLVHPHVINHVNISLAEKVRKTIQSEFKKEDHQLKAIHDFEEKQMRENHLKLEQQIKKIHEEAERKSHHRMMELQHKILAVIAAAKPIQEQDIAVPVKPLD